MARLNPKSGKGGKATSPPIIVKRITKVTASHHGGSWKIAYADFVTALMAFFLLMWLVGSTTSDRLRAISEYFKTPLRTVLNGGKEDSDATSVISGGSNAHTVGNLQVKMGDRVPPPTATDIRAGQLSLHLDELARLQQLKRQLEHAIEVNPALQKFKNQLLLDITSDGLRIQIIDQQNRPMFNLGSAVLQPYTIEILHEIGNALNDVPNRISLSGHTDAAPYQGGENNYSNWELSLDRANASRRELVAGGMAPSKIMRVVGLASSALFNPKNPMDPSNRRISIIVMNSSAEKNVSLEGSGEANADDVPAVPPASAH